MMLVPAQSLMPTALVALFNDGYGGYPVPLHFDEPAFRRHIVHHDLDLTSSQVVMLPQPAAFALVARRGSEAWVGGMGAVPLWRRQGHGERALTAALEAVARVGADTVRLEVLQQNPAAIALYLKLGFTVTRDLMVWTLTPPQRPLPPHRPLTVQAAQDWIAAHRRSPEPWQRADATLGRMSTDGVRLTAIVIERAGETVAAVIYAEEAAAVRVLQFAAIDEDAATQALLAASAGRKALRLANFPGDAAIDGALVRLGAEIVVVQHEMRRALVTVFSSSARSM